MTQDEFDSTRWGADMAALYHRDNETHDVVSVDFQEKLVGLEGVTAGSDEPNWVRCENITLVDA